MKNRSLLLIVVAFLVGPIAFVSRAAGQQDNFWRDFSDWEARRDALNSVGDGHPRSSRSRRGVAIPQRSLDFKRIQALNLELKQAVSLAGALDLRSLAKSAAEINKRAKRLQFSLGLPKPTEHNRKKVEAKLDELRTSLPRLGSSITDFVENPVFKNDRAVDAKLLIKAGDDLKEVIELSDWVKKSSKRLANRPVRTK